MNKQFNKKQKIKLTEKILKWKEKKTLEKISTLQKHFLAVSKRNSISCVTEFLLRGVIKPKKIQVIRGFK